MASLECLSISRDPWNPWPLGPFSFIDAVENSLITNNYH